MWDAIRNVTSAVTLVAFVAAVAAWVYSIWLNRKERLIRTAPESTRADLVVQALEFFHVNTERLTREQQYELAVKQLQDKHRRFTIGAVVVTVVAVLAAIILLVALFHDSSGKPPGQTQRPLDDIDIAEVAFLDYPEDSTAPRLDVKLTNQGIRTAFVKKAKINVKKTWRLADLPQVAGALAPPSHNYVVKIKPSREPYSVDLQVSHGLKPDDYDRFTIQLEEEPWPDSNTIYLADVEIISNSNDATFTSKDLLFLITQRGTTFPDSAALQEIVRREKSRGREVDMDMLKKAISENKATIREVSKIEGKRNRSLERLIDTADKSDLQ